MDTPTPATHPTHRTCTRCKVSLPATPEVFVKDASRPLGLAYECRPCHRGRKLGRDTRTDRYSNLTPAQLEQTKARQKRYAQTDRGRACGLRSAYRKIDACDLSTEEVCALIAQPCVYCGTVDIPRGLDRISNAGAHTRGNVRPACAPCNFARGDRFTAEEMEVIGATIRQVLASRKLTGSGS